MANKYRSRDRFKKVYFVVQTHPKFNVCRHLFSKSQADALATKIEFLTGTKGKVIEFSRYELLKLQEH